ncbi:RusA family crossover junction endodeoxyribonuclease (plasmid) [Streptomyces seoulensis]|uniref:RusA family crossover junction endodeoxyribonuclease n=1 Tax=Streptomyces seoulensis TaxID=73044 RepID=A0A4P6U5H4_STRSO|nr:RusA family crossover junction endodeoxyribonuclease [Streptomyces seoulensis]QBJ94481.1 RusA family crossover junction endodeoxyribonuclease [Streptomyces seoulensis]
MTTTTPDESFSVYLAGEQIEGTNLGITYIRVATPIGDLRMTTEEAQQLAATLQHAALYDHTPQSTYDWEPEPALTVTVYGLAGPQGSKSPVGWGRSRKTGKAIPLMRESSAKVKPWRDKVTAAITEALDGAQPLVGPVRADITFTMPKPGRAPKRRRTYPAVSPDIDKLERSTYDAITTAKAWEDDGRVIENHNRKVYPDEHPDALPEPGAIIRLYTLTGDHR